MANAGMNIIEWTTIECARPRWYRPGMSRSISGIKPKRNINGSFSFTFNGFVHILATKYPSERWPTANVCLALFCLSERCGSLFYCLCL